MATALGISVGSLSQWKSRQGRRRGRAGRPEVIPARAREKIRSSYLSHYGQWGPRVLAAWCQREELGAWCASTIARAISDLREPSGEPHQSCRIEVTHSGVMWSEDGTSFGRGRRKRELLVVQDEHARLKLNWKLARGAAREAHVVDYLEQAFREHGPPLVLKHDGDSIFHGDRMRRLLARWQVLDLTGPSYWPRYNGKKERSMRDIKSMERALRKHGVGGSLAERIDLAMNDLNEERPRPMLKGRTAREVYEAEPVDDVDRDALAKEVKGETRRLRTQARSRRERQAARRHAVELVLSRYGYLREMDGSVN